MVGGRSTDRVTPLGDDSADGTVLVGVPGVDGVPGVVGAGATIGGVGFGGGLLEHPSTMFCLFFNYVAGGMAIGRLQPLKQLIVLEMCLIGVVIIRLPGLDLLHRIP